MGADGHRAWGRRPGACSGVSAAGRRRATDGRRACLADRPSAVAARAAGAATRTTCLRNGSAQMREKPLPLRPLPPLLVPLRPRLCPLPCLLRLRRPWGFALQLRFFRRLHLHVLVEDRRRIRQAPSQRRSG